jgi:hypothetical protein
MDIQLQKFTRGKSNVPFKDTFFSSVGLNPFLENGKLISKYEFQSEANSGVLTSLKGIAKFVELGGNGYAFNAVGGEIYKSTSFAGGWSLLHTNAKNDGHQDAIMAPLYTSPTATNLYYVANEGSDAFIGTCPTPYADGDFSDSWKTLTGGASKTVRMAVIRDWVLFTFGQNLGGWKFSSTSDTFSTNLLDFKPGSVAINVVGTKSGGIRKAYIAVQYTPDRNMDGVYVWDLEDPAPIDFIPVPYLYDIYSDKGIIYACYGNKITVAPLTDTGPSPVSDFSSVLQNVILRADAPTAKFKGSYLGLILLGVSGTRDIVNFGYGYYPGLWAYNPANGALFFWMTPSTGELRNVIVNSVHVREDRELRASFTTVDYSTTSYYIQVLNKQNSSLTIRNELVGPILGWDSKDKKHWSQLSFNHNLLTLASLSPRIEVWRRDFTRENTVISTPSLVAITANTFKCATSSENMAGVRVGDYVRVTGGTGAGQVRRIISTSIDGSYTIFTVDRNWDTNPTTDSYIEWLPYIFIEAITEKSADLAYKDVNISHDAVLFQPIFVITFTGQTGTTGIELRNITVSVTATRKNG